MSLHFRNFWEKNQIGAHYDSEDLARDLTNLEVFSEEKSESIQSLQWAVLEMNEVKQGKRKSRPIEDLLNELQSRNAA